MRLTTTITQAWSRPPITKAMRPLLVKLAIRAHIIEAIHRMPTVLSGGLAPLRRATSTPEWYQLNALSVNGIALLESAAEKLPRWLSQTITAAGGTHPYSVSPSKSNRWQ